MSNIFKFPLKKGKNDDLAFKKLKNNQEKLKKTCLLKFNSILL